MAGGAQARDQRHLAFAAQARRGARHQRLAQRLAVDVDAEAQAVERRGRVVAQHADQVGRIAK